MVNLWINDFILSANVFYGIPGCYAQFKVPLSEELRVAGYPGHVKDHSLVRSEDVGSMVNGE
jgi:hypothetical protein